MVAFFSSTKRKVGEFLGYVQQQKEAADRIDPIMQPEMALPQRGDSWLFAYFKLVNLYRLCFVAFTLRELNKEELNPLNIFFLSLSAMACVGVVIEIAKRNDENNANQVPVQLGMH